MGILWGIWGMHMGHLVTEDGLKPDHKKINGIVNMPLPTDVSLRHLLGMTKYLSQYTVYQMNSQIQRLYANY